ncbi:hypothetical protein [Nonomuraea sp. SYSU D8015]|uniref:hypothetical protein n=1 Tax=Nonomuraea sp. SYSU D8015 TaxID=2593644 RepID=UPI0016610808|nr:hypothetical protein [Nonomuraea sp. SYSU D8015]
MEWAYDGLQQIQMAVGHAAEVTTPSPQAPQAGEEWCDVLVTMIHEGRTHAADAGPLKTVRERDTSLPINWRATVSKR